MLLINYTRESRKLIKTDISNKEPCIECSQTMINFLEKTFNIFNTIRDKNQRKIALENMFVPEENEKYTENCKPYYDYVNPTYEILYDDSSFIPDVNYDKLCEKIYTDRYGENHEEYHNIISVEKYMDNSRTNNMYIIIEDLNEIFDIFLDIIKYAYTKEVHKCEEYMYNVFSCCNYHKYLSYGRFVKKYDVNMVCIFCSGYKKYTNGIEHNIDSYNGNNMFEDLILPLFENKIDKIIRESKSIMRGKIYSNIFKYIKTNSILVCRQMITDYNKPEITYCDIKNTTSHIDSIIHDNDFYLS
jgi:hypothetical protein